MIIPLVDGNPKEYRRVFLWLVLLLLANAAGYVDTIDADPSIRTAERILDTGSPAIALEEPQWDLYWQGRGYLWYTKLGLTLPLLYLPCVLLARTLDGWGFPEAVWTKFLVSLVNPLLTAVLLLVLYQVLRTHREPGPSFRLVLVALMATLLLPYSKTCHREVLQALLLTGAFAALLPERSLTRPRAALAGLCVGLGWLTKLAFLVPALPLAGFLLHRCHGQRDYRAVRAFLLGFLPCVAVWAAYATYAWGSPFATGYSANVMNPSGKAWATPFALGLYAQLFDWHKGWFFYNPLALALLPVGVREVRRGRWGGFEIAVAMAFLAQLALHARWFSPTGMEMLGPRYLIVILPLGFLLIRRADLSVRSRALRLGAGAGVALCIALQLVHTSVKPQQYYTLKLRAQSPISDPHWIANLKFFSRKVAGGEERYAVSDFGAAASWIVDLGDVNSMGGFNFWWLHALRNGPTARPVPPSLQKAEAEGGMNQRGESRGG